MVEVRRWLQEAGLEFVKEEQMPYPVFGSSNCCCTRMAHAGVWVQPSLTEDSSFCRSFILEGRITAVG